jgi:mannan endo-1,4-beta-mannosidase
LVNFNLPKDTAESGNCIYRKSQAFLLLKIMKKIFILVVFSLFACSNSNEEETAETQTEYAILGSKIVHNGVAKQFIGANAMHTFGGNSDDMSGWNLDIVREFVGNMKEQPLSGNPIQDSNGVWLHSLQKVVDNNRQNHKITVICGFRWDGKDSTLFTGKKPSSEVFWVAFKAKLEQWAVYFKDQPDVWIAVWNEPYRWDRADGYTDALWTSDMNEMYRIVRAAGNKNIVILPVAEQGQDESVLINVGKQFLVGKSNVLFDIHAYEKWQIYATNTAVESRLDALKNNNFAVFFGETAPVNSSGLMQPQFFLTAAYNRGMSISAWLWKYDATDANALLDGNGQPNDWNNNGWGTMFKTLAGRVRVP